MSRPKIQLQLDPIDWLIEAIGFITLLILMGLPAYYFDSLPDTIPTHFGLNGVPDDFSSKGMIWLLPATGLVMYLGMAILNKFPHIFNYPQEITENNAEKQYKAATRLIRTMNTLITGTFVYMTYSTIHTAINNHEGLGNYFTLIFMVAILGVIGVYLYKSLK